MKRRYILSIKNIFKKIGKGICNKIPRCELWQAMRRMDVKKEQLKLVRRIYKNNEAKINIGNTTTTEISFNKQYHICSRIGLKVDD